MSHPWLGWAVVLLASGCSQALERAVPREPLRQDEADQDVAVEVLSLLTGEDLWERGVTEDAVMGVTLRLHNAARAPYRLSVAEVWLLLAGDERHPEKTLSWAPMAGGEGPAPSRVTDDLALGTVTLAPAETRDVWIMFRGYRFAGSDVPRRVTLVLPGPLAGAGQGRPVHVQLANPARGELRWDARVPQSQLMASIQSQDLLGRHSRTQFAGSALVRVARAGAFLWDFEFQSGLAVQSEGALASTTSTFSVSALALHLTAPLVTWGPWQDPRRFGLFAGGGGALWTSVVTPSEARAGQIPRVYGALFIDAGLEWDLGTWRSVSTPFPLSFDERPGLPRWSLRFGYTQSWLGGGTTAGTMSAARFTF